MLICFVKPNVYPDTEHVLKKNSFVLLSKALLLCETQSAWLYKKKWKKFDHDVSEQLTRS